MLTFEKVLKVFQAYLDDDPLYEVVQTSHGYTPEHRVSMARTLSPVPLPAASFRFTQKI